MRAWSLWITTITARRGMLRGLLFHATCFPLIKSVQRCILRPRKLPYGERHTIEREGLAMSQLYLQRFAYRAGAKSEFDQAWVTALQTFAKSGNWGGVEAGVRHLKSYGTAWGGYVLIEVDDPDAFARYQLHHSLNYGHMVQITFEPIFDLDAALEQRVREART